MSVEYKVLQTRERNEEGSYMGYGLQAYLDGRAADRIPDITTDREAMRRLAAMCNAGGVALCHMRDVAEDWLAR